MHRSAASLVVIAAALILAACTRTSGYPPASCAAATGIARDHINSFIEIMGKKWPTVIEIVNPVETKVVTGTGRYKLERFCAGDARFADETRGRALWVIRDKGEGLLGGFGFYACIVGRDEGCTEDTP
jgi:hypothetical protein